MTVTRSRYRVDFFERLQCVKIFTTLASVLLAILLSSSCSIMKQTARPSASGTIENNLSSVVSLIPINAETLQTVVKPKSTTPDLQGLSPSSAQWQYRIGPGDVLSIVVWDHPQLTIPAGPQRTPQEAGNWVGPDGTIFYPYIGTLDVSDKTINEVRLAVAEGLRSVIPNPQVDVSIARFSSRKVQITGAVTSPGAVTITNIPLTLADAIEQRQGALVDSNLKEVALIRDGKKHEINLQSYLTTGNENNNPQLRGNDVVVIPRLENNQVYVMGEVRTPGVVPLNGQPLSLTGALADRDGLSKTSADASGIFVFRSDTDKRRILVYQLDITDPTALLLGAHFQLLRGDVVYATSAPAARWSRVIGNIVPSLGALNTLLLIEDRS